MIIALSVVAFEVNSFSTGVLNFSLDSVRKTSYVKNFWVEHTYRLHGNIVYQSTVPH